jgi:hypothetical protein
MSAAGRNAVRTVKEKKGKTADKPGGKTDN